MLRRFLEAVVLVELLGVVIKGVDEKTAIQALDRKDRMLPLAPGRAESHGFEYKRNGTLTRSTKRSASPRCWSWSKAT